MPLSTYFKNLMLDAGPNTVYAAMFAGGAPGTGTEVTPATLWGSGNRPAIALDAAASGARTPTGDIDLGTVAIASQAVTHIAFYDADTAGNLLGYDDYALTLEIGMIIRFGDVANVLSLTDPA